MQWMRLALVLGCLALPLAAAESNPREYFEMRVRPLLGPSFVVLAMANRGPEAPPPP